MDAFFIVQVLLGAAAAGFIQGLSGFAFGLVALSFWAWSIDPRLAGPMVVFGSLVGQIGSLPAIWHHFDWRRALPFIIGGVAGVPVGVWLLAIVDIDIFRTTVGVLLLVYCSAMLMVDSLPPITRGGRLADGVAGWIGGVMGGLGGLNGPAPTLWCSLRAWDKDTQRVIFQTFSLTMQFLTLAAYAAGNMLTPTAWRTFVLMIPAVLLPVWAGVRIYRRLSGFAFRRLILVLLLGSGLALCTPAALHLLR
ncbi:MAG TPA: sulfite exporter TauE/SafE family protein [Xanthobacteraceae bacterium]|nr:sulfite exporter TauE/SafE family protein [Xanthobacteraceae bacterium]